MTAQLNVLGVPVTEDLFMGVHQQIQGLCSRIERARAEGSARRIRELEKELKKWLRSEEGRRASTIDRGVVCAALGECRSIRGRWTGDIRRLRSGVREVRKFLEILEEAAGERERSPQATAVVRAAIARCRAWLGNTLTRVAYLTRCPDDLDDAVYELDAALDDMHMVDGVPKELRASTLRDMGDAFVGRLLWKRGVPVDGRSLRKLRLAVVMFDELGKDWQHEAFAVRSSLALAAALSAHKVRNYLEDVTAELKGGDQELIEEAAVCVTKVLTAYAERRRDRGAPAFRWARTTANAAFAAKILWLLTGDIQHWKLADRAFRQMKYSRDDHAFRWAVVTEGRANLYYARLAHGPLRRGDRKKWAEKAIKAYDRAALTLEQISRMETDARAQKVRDAQQWVAAYVEDECPPGINFRGFSDQSRAGLATLEGVDSEPQFVPSRASTTRERPVPHEEGTSSTPTQLRGEFARASLGDLIATCEAHGVPTAALDRLRELVDVVQQAQCDDYSAVTIDRLVAGFVPRKANVPRISDVAISRLAELVRSAGGAGDKAAFVDHVNALMDEQSLEFKLGGDRRAKHLRLARSSSGGTVQFSVTGSAKLGQPFKIARCPRGPQGTVEPRVKGGRDGLRNS